MCCYHPTCGDGGGGGGCGYHPTCGDGGGDGGAMVTIPLVVMVLMGEEKWRVSY